MNAIVYLIKLSVLSWLDCNHHIHNGDLFLVRSTWQLAMNICSQECWLCKETRKMRRKRKNLPSYKKIPLHHNMTSRITVPRNICVNIHTTCLYMYLPLITYLHTYLLMCYVNSDGLLMCYVNSDGLVWVSIWLTTWPKWFPVKCLVAAWPNSTTR